MLRLLERSYWRGRLDSACAGFPLSLCVTTAQTLDALLSRRSRYPLLLLCTVGCSEPLRSPFCEYGTGPLFRVVAVRDSASEATLPAVRISNIVANGRAYGPAHMSYLVEVGITHGVTIDGNGLVCRPVCTFGFEEEGSWEMTFSQTGYLSKTLQVMAFYSERKTTGCWVTLTGPVDLTVSLQRDVLP
jgi:hypothetical protein